MNVFAAHKTKEVVDILCAHNITISVILGGGTGFVQALNVSINLPFKDILKVPEGGEDGINLLFSNAKLQFQNRKS